MIQSGTLDGRPCSVVIQGDGSERDSIAIYLAVAPDDVANVVRSLGRLPLSLETGETLTVVATSCNPLGDTDITSVADQGMHRFADLLQVKAHMLRQFSQLSSNWPPPPKLPIPTYW